MIDSLVLSWVLSEVYGAEGLSKILNTGSERHPLYQWLLLVPVKGGIGGIVHPPIGRKNTTYIPLIVLAEPGG